MQTFSDVPYQSPLAGKNPPTALSTDHPVGLADLSGRCLLLVQGVAAENLLKDLLGAVPQSIGEVVGDASPGAAHIARLTREQFLVGYAAPTGEPNALLDAGGNSAAILTDITHGRGHMLLFGARAADALAKVCGLDFAEGAFPNRTCAQTSLAKVKTLIVRLDEGDTPTYHLMVDRSLAVYVWDVVFDAIQQFKGF